MRMKVEGLSFPAKQQVLLVESRATNQRLQRKIADLEAYVRVLEADTEMLRSGKVVPREVVDGLEEYFADKEIQARRVPELEKQLEQVELQAAEARRQMQNALDRVAQVEPVAEEARLAAEVARAAAKEARAAALEGAPTAGPQEQAPDTEMARSSVTFAPEVAPAAPAPAKPQAPAQAPALAPIGAAAVMEALPIVQPVPLERSPSGSIKPASAHAREVQPAAVASAQQQAERITSLEKEIVELRSQLMQAQAQAAAAEPQAVPAAEPLADAPADRKVRFVSYASAPAQTGPRFVSYAA